MRIMLSILALLLSGLLAAGDAPAAPARIDGRNADAFSESRAAIEADMGDASRLAFHMNLAQIRNKLAEQRGRPLTDAEFAMALDGKTLAEVNDMAKSAPLQITIDIEKNDDT